jgi:hypothetical protein
VYSRSVENIGGGIVAKYERIEAEALIARAMGPQRENYSAMGTAAKELLDELVQMNGFCGTTINWIQPQSPLVEIQLGARLGWVAFRMSESAFLSGTDGPSTTIAGLRFNPVTTMWEGTDDDDFVVPTPGQPRAKRAALAVIIRHVCRMLAIDVR